METVDACLGRIVDWVESNNAFAILTSDHGNCEMMQDASGMPLTAHTVLPVPFILIDPMHHDASIVAGGRLCDIAPTFLSLWNIVPPREMTGKNLAMRK